MSVRALAACLGVWLIAANASADAIVPVDVPNGQVRVDGALRDWEGVPLTGVGTTGRQMRYAVGRDAASIYVAARVSDERLVRHERIGPTNDAIVLTFVMPAGQAWRATEVWLFPGDLERVEAAAALAVPGQEPRAATGIDVVEGPLERGAAGYIIEARIPLGVLPAGSRIGEARAAIRLHDVDSEAHPVANDDVASARFDAAHPESLPSFGTTAVSNNAYEQFLERSGLRGVRPSIDTRADVVAGSEPDRVLLIQNTLVVLPTNGAPGSSSFAFATLPFARDAATSSPMPVSLTANRDKIDFAFDVATTSTSGGRTTRYFVTFERGTVDVLGALDTRRSIGSCALTNRIVVSGPSNNEGAQITVTPVTAPCARPNAWAWPNVENASFLLPWGELSAVTYRVDRSGLTMLRSTRNPNAYVPAAQPVPAPPSRPAVPTAAAPGDTLAQFRSDQHVDPGAQVRFARDANVAESAAPEHVVVIDRNVVVTGAAFRGGVGYAFTSIPVAQASDILSLTVDDITGDGVAEMLVRARQLVGDVTREVILVHRFTDRGIARVLAVEVQRSRGPNTVQALASIHGDGRARRLTVRPGTAVGWTETTYPFTPEASPGMEALILPWSRNGVRYEWTDNAFRATTLSR